MSHLQFQSRMYLYLDMHGLIFETSVWLLAESTRLLSAHLELAHKISHKCVIHEPTSECLPSRDESLLPNFIRSCLLYNKLNLRYVPRLFRWKTDWIHIQAKVPNQTTVFTGARVCQSHEV